MRTTRTAVRGLCARVVCQNLRTETLTCRDVQVRCVALVSACFCFARDGAVCAVTLYTCLPTVQAKPVTFPKPLCLRLYENPASRRDEKTGSNPSHHEGLHPDPTREKLATYVSNGETLKGVLKRRSNLEDESIEIHPKPHQLKSALQKVTMEKKSRSGQPNGWP